jgi:hypothetical protein
MVADEFEVEIDQREGNGIPSTTDMMRFDVAGRAQLHAENSPAGRDRGIGATSRVKRTMTNYAADPL